jgi:hypothetical protein
MSMPPESHLELIKKGEARSRPPRRTMTLAILDIDGTLVETNYQHALAWYSAFRKHGLSAIYV